MAKKRDPVFPQLERLGVRGSGGRKRQLSYRFAVPVDKMIEAQDAPVPSKYPTNEENEE